MLPTTHVIMTSAKIKCWTLNRLSHPGTLHHLSFFFLRWYLFILESEKESAHTTWGEAENEGETGRGRGNESQADFTCSVYGPQLRLDPMTPDHDLSQNQESDAQLTDPPCCPTSYF